MKRKAFMRVIEAVIAAMLILTFTFVVASKAREKAEDEFYKEAYSSFYSLEVNGSLRPRTSDENLTKLRQDFDKIIRADFNYTLALEKEDATTGPLAALPANKTVRAYAYIASGNENNFEPSIFLLYHWR